MINVLPEKEKKQDQVEWYEPRIKPFDEFLIAIVEWEESMELQSDLEQQEPV